MKNKDRSKKEIIPHSGINKVRTFILVFGASALALVIVFLSVSKKAGVFPVYTDSIMTGVRIGNYKALAEPFLWTSVFVVLAVYFVIIFFKQRFEKTYIKVLIYAACICTIVFLPAIMLGKSFAKMEISKVPDGDTLVLEREFLFFGKTETTELEYKEDYTIHLDRYATADHRFPDGETLSIEESSVNRHVIYAGDTLDCERLGECLSEVTGLRFYRTKS